MEEKYVIDRFSPHVGTTFRVAVGDGEPVVLELIEAKPLTPSPCAPRQDPFALMFRGPVDLFFPQNIYAISHPLLGTMELFLIPRQPDPDGSYFECIFN